jgi:hypothetical protein
MKNPLQKITMLGKVTQFKTRIKDYSLVANTLEEFVLRQERFIDRVAWRSALPPKLIRTLIHESTTIMTFATLLGFDIAGLKGAAVGAAVGGVVVIGNVAFRIIFIRKMNGIDLEIVEI